MNVRLAACAVGVLVVTGCSAAPSREDASVDRESARKVSDSFISALADDRVRDAVGKMEAAFVSSMSAADAEASIRKMFEYCGRPLDSELKHEETGFKIYPDGQKKTTRQFIYATTTTLHAKGECFFSVTVVPDVDGLRVTNYGPLKLASGQLPDWAR